MDVEAARTQHRAYERTLGGLGCNLLSLPEAPDLPDSVFVEDAAVVLDELAVVARSGAPSRRPEAETIERALESHRECKRIESPATLDGGDVLRVGRALYVGLSTRTNLAAAEQLRKLLRPYGYEVREVSVTGCLHLKSAATRVAANTLLVNPAWLDLRELGHHDWLEVDPREPFGANALLVGQTVLCSTLFPRTRDRLADHGIDVADVDLSELAKAEGGVTCCSIVFEASA